MILYVIHSAISAGIVFMGKMVSHFGVSTINSITVMQFGFVKEYEMKEIMNYDFSLCWKI